MRSRILGLFAGGVVGLLVSVFWVMVVYLAWFTLGVMVLTGFGPAVALHDWLQPTGWFVWTALAAAPLVVLAAVGFVHGHEVFTKWDLDSVGRQKAVSC